MKRQYILLDFLYQLVFVINVKDIFDMGNKNGYMLFMKTNKGRGYAYDINA